jgi:hypothetical protein
LLVCSFSLRRGEAAQIDSVHFTHGFTSFQGGLYQSKAVLARKENSKMSEKEKVMIEKISKLPSALQDKFCDKLDGAIMALDTMQTEKPASSAGEKAS